MMNAKTALTISLLIPLLGGCVHSFRKAPKLAFADIPYTSLAGEAWPAKTFTLPRPGKAPIAVHYVELNPQGGQTLIFIHGLGSYLKFWRYQLDHFAKQGYRVIALDLPGYGKSDKPASFPYTMEAMADCVYALARSLKIERPVLFGHSMGGQTALSFAIRYPAAARAIVLVSPAGFEKFSKKEQAWFQKVVTTHFIKKTPEYGVWGAVRYNNFYRWRPAYEWLIEERMRLTRSPAEFDRYAYANVRSISGLAENDFVRESARYVKVPTLIVYGDKDRLIPNPFMHGGSTRCVMQRGHRAIAGSELEGLHNCGHTLQMDCAAEFNARAERFLQQNAPARPAAVAAPAETAPQTARAPTSQATSKPASQPAAP